MKKYLSEDKKNYKIKILYCEQKIKILFYELESENEENKKNMKNKENKENKTIFLSKYHLDDLNVKFMKIKQFKTIEEFIDLLLSNINQKKLIIKPPYKNVITSVWRIFPESKDKKQTFSLVSSLNYNKKISLLFYSDYKASEKVVKEIETPLNVNVNNVEKKDEISYLNLSYNNNLFIDKMLFLQKNYSDEEEKLKDFKKIYDNIRDIEVKNEGKRVILVFFNSGF